jgi:hypothetical protein
MSRTGISYALVQAAEQEPTGGAAVVYDSRGISVLQFDLTLYNGNPLNPADAHLMIWNLLTVLYWDIYRFITSGMIWLLDWALSMVWVEWLLTPMQAVSVLTQSVMGYIGLMPLMLAILATVVGFWLMRGRYGGGIAELLIGATIAGLAVYVLSNPWAMVAGPDGVIYSGRDAGMDIATAVVTEGRVQTSDQTLIREATIGSLTDTLIRAPHQMMNYGEIIDGTRCEDVYDRSLAETDETAAREMVAECDPAYKTWSDQPNAFKFAGTTSLLLTAGALGFFSLGLVAVLFITVLGAAWSAIKLVVLLVTGIVPGGPRAALMRTFADVGFAAIMIAVCIGFIVMWMKLLLAFFAVSAPVPWQMRMTLANVLIVAGVIVLIIFRVRIKRAMRNLGDKIAQLGPHGRKPAEPQKIFTMARMADWGWEYWTRSQAGARAAQPQMRSIAPPSPGATGMPPAAPPQPGGTPPSRPGGRSGPGPHPTVPSGPPGPPAVGGPAAPPPTAPSPVPAGPQPAPVGPGRTRAAEPAVRLRRTELAARTARATPSPHVRRLRKVVAKGAKTAVKAGVIAASGGSSAAVTGAAKAAKVVRVVQTVHGATRTAQGAVRSTQNLTVRKQLDTAQRSSPTVTYPPPPAVPSTPRPASRPARIKSTGAQR